MEKVSLIKRKPINNNLYENEYSFLNRQHDAADKMNCLSLDLERLKKNSSMLPSITSERKNLINAVSQKLRLLKQKIKQKQQERQKAVADIETMITMPIPMSMPMPMPMSMPMSMPMPMPMPGMQYPFTNPPYNMSCCHQCNHSQPKKHRRKQKKQKKKQEKQETKVVKIKKRNRFRIYGYAIYFSIFIKYYTQRFTENRKKWFTDRYCRKDKGIIYEGSEKVLRKLQELDFYQISQDAKQRRHINGINEGIIDWEEQTNTALVPASIQSTDKTSDSVSQYIINFVELLLSKASDLILDDQFIQEYHEVFSAGSLDLNFMIDNLYLPEQVPFLFVHPIKGYIRLSYRQEIQLLLVKVMIKMIIFNFLLGLSKSKTWCKKEESNHKLAQYQIEEMWEIGRTLAIYLYIICKDLYLTAVKNLSHQSNFNELCKRFGIKQAKHLQESKVSEDEGEGEKSFELIRNIKNYRMTAQKINRNHRLNQYKTVLKEKIVDLLANLHEKLKKEERGLYVYIRNMTLSVPYLIFEGMKAKDELKKKKNQHYKILKPNGKTGSNWNNIYASVSNSHSSEKSKSKSKNVKFNDSSDTNRERSSARPESRTGSKNNEKMSKNSNSQNSRDHPQSNKVNQGHNGLEKAQQIKKPFNIDTVNKKYDENRQDRLRQKFRNMLSHNGQS